MHLSSVDADKCICAAGDIQAPEAQEAGKGEAAEKTVSPADRQALLQFLRMMRKGKVRPRPRSCVPLLYSCCSGCCGPLAHAKADRPVWRLTIPFM